jgi:TRAP-type C4-dicarboxylate transport system permease small subunit
MAGDGRTVAVEPAGGTVLDALIDGLARVNAPILAACRLSTVLLLAGIAAIVAVGVFWRYVLNDALSWYEEVAKFLMLWLAFVASPLALPTGGHVAVELLPSALPRRARHALAAVVMLTVAVLMGWLTWFGTTFAWNGRLQVSPTVGEISMAWIFASIPVGSAMMLLVALELALRHLGFVVDPARRTGAVDVGLRTSWS